MFPPSLIPLLNLGATSEPPRGGRGPQGKPSKAGIPSQPAQLGVTVSVGFQRGSGILPCPERTRAFPRGTATACHRAQTDSPGSGSPATRTGQWVRAACGEAELCRWFSSPQPKNGWREYRHPATRRHVQGGSFLLLSPTFPKLAACEILPTCSFCLLPCKPSWGLRVVCFVTAGGSHQKVTAFSVVEEL